MKNYNYDYQLISGSTEQVFKNKVKAMEGASEISEGKGEIYLNFIKHYASIYRPVGSERLLKVGDQIIVSLFGQGQGALYLLGQECFVVDTYDVEKIGYDKKPLQARGQLINSDNNSFRFNMNRENSVFFKANYYAGPLFMGLDKFIEPIQKLGKLIPTDIINSIASLNFFLNDEKDVEKLKQLAIMNDKGCSYKVFSGANSFSKEVIQTNSVSENIMEAIDYVFNTMYRLRGRKINVNEKFEEVKEEEVKSNEEQFVVVNEDFKYYLDALISDGNALTGENVRLAHLREYSREIKAKEEEKKDEELNDVKQTS